MSGDTASSTRRLWNRLTGPIKVGLVFAALGLILAIVGIVRGEVPPRAASIFIALLISGGSWGIVSWAIATAARDVDRDIAAAEEIEAQTLAGDEEC
jgi:hypothetical protein